MKKIIRDLYVELEKQKTEIIKKAKSINPSNIRDSLPVSKLQKKEVKNDAR